MKAVDGSRPVYGDEANKIFTDILAVQDLLKQSVFDELMLQRGQWGTQDHTVPEWIMLLVEEFGEVSQAVLKGDRKSAIKEAVQCSALLVQLIERLIRETEEQ